MSHLKSAVERHLPGALTRLAEYVTFRTVAAEPATDMRPCIAFLEREFTDLGARVEILTLPGAQPVVFAEFQGSGPNSLLIYQHYDVMPPGPRDAWNSDPFTLTDRNGRMVARGIADNKANLIARLTALRVLLDEYGTLPLTVRFVIEGEEEIGSPNLPRFLEEYDELIRADGCLWEGGYRDSDGRLTISLGIKGMCRLRLTAHGPTGGVHGKFAPIAVNPIQRLVGALATLADADGTVRVPGYYDSVLPPTDEALAQIAGAVPSGASWYKKLGIDEVLVTDPIQALQRLIFFSGCSIGAISSGDGTQRDTVPEIAQARVSFRLVPNQQPEATAQQIKQYLNAQGFGDVDIEFLHGVAPAQTAPDHALARAAEEAAHMVDGIAPAIWPMSPSSGPMAIVCQNRGIPAVAFGVGHAGSATHAPNENIDRSDFAVGIHFACEFFRQLAAKG